MAELLKDIFSPSFIEVFAKDLKEIYPDFDGVKFSEKVFDKVWESKELKQRMRHITEVLHTFLPQNYRASADIICKLVSYYLQNGHGENTLAFCFLPDYIELYGIDDLEASQKAMELITQFITCEFAVRPFIIKYEKEMVKQMTLWSKHPHKNVRRFASEGIRPRLPWAMALPSFKKDPTDILPILENLKNDSSEFVRRSVANNLNDISKDNPEVVIEIFRSWKGISKETDWVIKHGSRTLLKQGDKEVLELFGLGHDASIELSEFQLLEDSVKVGNDIYFQFNVKNNSKENKTIRLEYAVYFNKANGQLSKKVFKISEREFAEFESLNYKRKLSFKIITTRKYYPGVHKVAMIANGKEHESLNFELV
ncbi:MAG: DNA alkylation repair protein [Thalassobius sp.]|nr:DNA alkylation repair protein [Thalassovita sp.]